MDVVYLYVCIVSHVLSTHVADLEIAQQVFERGVVRNDGRLSAAVDGADEREGQVQDVAVQQLLLLLEEHRKRLRTQQQQRRHQQTVSHTQLLCSRSVGAQLFITCAGTLDTARQVATSTEY